MLIKLATMSLLLAGLTTLAIADHHHHPPKEAIDACNAKAVGDTCSFTHGDHAIDGTCAAPPDGNTGELACRPNHPPGPPPEAIDACANHTRGQSCSFQHRDHAVSGTCDSPPDHADTLACRPEDGPH